eukprot:7388759-Prymnesium_polylepis.1
MLRVPPARPECDHDAPMVSVELFKLPGSAVVASRHPERRHPLETATPPAAEAVGLEVARAIGDAAGARDGENAVGLEEVEARLRDEGWQVGRQHLHGCDSEQAAPGTSSPRRAPCGCG